MAYKKRLDHAREQVLDQLVEEAQSWIWGTRRGVVHRAV